MADIKKFKKLEKVNSSVLYNYHTLNCCFTTGRRCNISTCNRGTIRLVTGDTLGSQYIGGYKQLASALRKCCYCMAVSDDMKQKVRTYYGNTVVIVHAYI